jgi:hypothetical protein
MARSLFDHLAMVGIAILAGAILIAAFQEWYDYTEQRRAEKRSRRNHPSSTRPRYE